MNLSTAIYTLPEQQQLDLLRYHADNIGCHGEYSPTQVFAASKGNKFVEDSMLVSDKVIDAYLDVIEKGIDYCVENNVSPINLINAYGIPVLNEWYERDLRTIASCPRLSPSHISRIHQLLSSIVNAVPIGKLVTEVYMQVHVAFCCNHLVGKETLKPLLVNLARRTKEEMLQTDNSSGNGYVNGILLEKLVDGIRKKRFAEPDVINLIEEIGYDIGNTVRGLHHLNGKFSSLHSKMSDIKAMIAQGMAQGGYRAKVVSDDEIIEAMKTFNYYEGNPVAELIAKNDCSLVDLDATPDIFVDASILITGIAKRLSKNNGSSSADSEQTIYIELMRRCTDLFFKLIDSGAANKVQVRAAARTIFTTIDNTALLDNACEEYSLLSTLDKIIKKGFIDAEFIKSATETKRLTKLHARAFHENPAISIDEMEYVIVSCYSEYMLASDLHFVDGKNSHDQLYKFLAEATPVLLNKKYYPALLANQRVDIAGLANAFEMGLFLSLLDEGDIKLIAKAGMNEVCQATNGRYKITLASEPALNDIVTSLMLKERLEQVDVSPAPSSKRRQIL